MVPKHQHRWATLPKKVRGGQYSKPALECQIVPLKSFRIPGLTTLWRKSFKSDGWDLSFTLWQATIIARHAMWLPSRYPATEGPIRAKRKDA